MTTNDANTVQATQTSLDIINEIQRLDGATMAQLADKLGLARSTIFSHLTTLQQNGYLTKRGEVYHLDFKFLFLGEYTKRRNDAYEVAEQQVKEMAGQCDQYVDFCVEQNGRLLTVHLANNGIQNPQFDIAEYYYMTTTAQGKAILSQMSRSRVNEIIEQWGLPRRTAKTITSRDRLFEEIEKVRDRGYAVTNQECIEGLRAVAVPIIAPDGVVFGAFGISGPTYEMTDEAIETKLVEVLREGKTYLEERPPQEYL